MVTFRPSRPIGTLREAATEQHTQVSEPHYPSFLSAFRCFSNINKCFTRSFPEAEAHFNLTGSQPPAGPSSWTALTVCHKPQTVNQPFFCVCLHPSGTAEGLKNTDSDVSQELGGTRTKAEASILAPQDTLLTNTLTLSPSRLHF